MAQVFEQRAKAAEDFVRALEAEIGALRAQAESELTAKLAKENEELRAQIQAAKNKLRVAQVAHGKPQFFIPGEKPAAAATAAAPAPASAAAPAPAKASAAKAAKPAAAAPAAAVPAAAAASAAAPTSAKAEKAGKQDKAKEGKSGDKKEAATAAAAAGDEKIDVSRVDFRVGRVVSAKKHPEADKLYIEEVDLGEGKNRTVLSGLADFIPLEQLQNRLIVLCTNLPPRKMKGTESQAMIMCANDGGNHVEIIDPPAGAVPGDRVECPDYPGPADPVLNPKKKIFETVQPDLTTNAAFVATYKGSPLTIKGKGVCKVQSLANCGIK